MLMLCKKKKKNYSRAARAWDCQKMFSCFHRLCSTVDFRRNPDWNVQTSLDFDHKKKRTGGMLSVKLGKDPTDKSKQFLLSTSVDRKIEDLQNVDIDYKIKAIAPMLVGDLNSFSFYLFIYLFSHSLY